MTLRPAVFLLVLACRPEPVPQPAPDVVIIRDALDASTGILGLRAVGRAVPETAWENLFKTKGYQRLEEREVLS